MSRVVLSPQEGVAALGLYVGSASQTDRWKSASPKDQAALLKVVSVLKPYQDRVLSSILLYGSLDASASLTWIDMLLAHHGMSFGCEKIIAEFKPSPSPFAHEVKNSSGSFEWSALEDSIRRSRQLASEVSSVMNLCGFQTTEGGKVTAEKVNSILAEERFVEGAPVPLLNVVEMISLQAIKSIDRAMEDGVPLMSESMAAPEWLSSAYQERKYDVLRIILDRVAWLPHPRTFEEASSMASDERIVGLRNDVDLLTERLVVGEIADANDLAKKIGSYVEGFREKPWAAHVGGLLQYAAVPILIGEAMAGSAIVGVSTAVVGTALQGIADRIDATRRNHWLSMGVSPFAGLKRRRKDE